MRALNPNNSCSSQFDLGFPYLCQLQSAIGKFLFFLEGDPINFGLSFGKVRQLLLDGILLLQEIVFLLQVRYPLLKKGDLLVFEWGFLIDSE